MQAWYWDYPKTIDSYNWADTLTEKSQELADAGFTYLWLPPLSRASFGSGSNGYDPQDLYDLGEFGLGATGFGTRADIDELFIEFNNVGINAIADVVYNHRDGGKPEINPRVEEWIENYDHSTQCQFPSDRFRNILPIGGTTGRGVGTYYFKVASKSKHSDYFGNNYTFYAWTNTVGWQSLLDENETEPNGGGDCGQGSTVISLGINTLSSIDNLVGDECGTDEFALTINTEDFDETGDTIYIALTNSGGYSDHYIYGLWDGTNNVDIQSEIEYQTYTDFTSMPSGRGSMNWPNFKPNPTNSTSLCGDEDWPWFFYDYDQNVTATRDSLFAWTKWLWEDVGVRGIRMDAIKHFPPEFVGDLFDYLHDNGIDPGIAVGEFFDSNAGLLNNWISQVYQYMDEDTKLAIYPRIFDFTLRQSLKDASDTFGYDVRKVFNRSLVDEQNASGFNVVTFLNNHDFRDQGQAVENDPILGYAFLLTNNQVGVPTIFYPDYYSVPEFPNGNLKTEIDKLIEIHKNNIFGATTRDYLSNFGTTYTQNFNGNDLSSTTLLYQLMNTPSGRDVIVGINYAGNIDTLKLNHGINTTNLNSGDVLVDLLGNSKYPFTTVSESDEIYVELPPRSYSVWVKGVTVQAKVFLEGPYDNSTGSMNTALSSNSYLPLTSPHNQDVRKVDEISESITDWMLLELYDDMNNPPVVSKSVFVRNDRRLVLEDGETDQIPLNAAEGEYHIVLRHRNHLAIRSTNKISISASTPLYDFTTSESQSFNNGTK
ncbi:MAG: hypothetical protein GY936_11700, partial [Ignavibacteriae bacterium]|nr:hypothetical protein [Ignavibacteriota bacterium]